MTVKELMKTLEGFDEDLEVGFEHPSHDYWRSMLIGEVDNVEEGYAKYSEYHQRLGVATEEEIEEAEYIEAQGEDPPERKRVKRMLILS